jgi:putative flippase GtrA
MVTGVDYLVFLLCLQLESGAAMANVVGRVLATGVGALLHRRFTFAGPQRWGLARQMIAYAALSAFNLGLSTAMIIAWVDHVGLGAISAKVLTDMVVMALSIAIGRLVIFAPAR